MELIIVAKVNLLKNKGGFSFVVIVVLLRCSNYLHVDHHPLVMQFNVAHSEFGESLHFHSSACKAILYKLLYMYFVTFLYIDKYLILK